ncbi:MAG: EamA family transporter RarD [Clostridia bacterium]|nr:EamA family transporter RarD [Clostridia bacterium]
MDTKKESTVAVISVLLCNIIWGLLPFYWNRLSHVDAITILSFRIICGAVFSVFTVIITGLLPDFCALAKDRARMKWLIPAALAVTVNWGTYIYAMVSENVMQASLGYYLEPLVIAAFGMLFFHERCNRWEWIALAFAAAGALYSTVMYGKLPAITLVLALSFSAYGAFKRGAGVSGILSIAMETTVLLPLAIGYLLLKPGVGAQMAVWDGLTWFLLAMAGPVTAIPLMLYTKGVNGLSLITMGFMQIVSPTLILLSGLMLGERPTTTDVVTFLAIWVGFAWFLYGQKRRHRVQLIASCEPEDLNTLHGSDF